MQNKSKQEERCFYKKKDSIISPIFSSKWASWVLTTFSYPNNPSKERVWVRYNELCVFARTNMGPLCSEVIYEPRPIKRPTLTNKLWLWQQWIQPLESSFLVGFIKMVFFHDFPSALGSIKMKSKIFSLWAIIYDGWMNKLKLLLSPSKVYGMNLPLQLKPEARP